MSKQPSEQATRAAPDAEFVQLFTRYQRRIYLFILGQVSNPVDAEEILQEANVVMLRKSDQFEIGTNFFAWACSVARFEILKYRDRFKRDRLHFSNEFLQLVEGETVKREAMSELRREALARCINKLSQPDRELIQLRYKPGNNGQSVAKTLDRPANSVYQSLSRIRKALMECITRRLASVEPT